MAITVYRSTDPGAPVVGTPPRILDSLKLILKACLVDGYSGKPGAGWELSHEVTDGITFSNGEGYINFSHYNTAAADVTLLESITDTSTAVPGGSNRRSGPWYDGQSTLLRQYVYSFLYSAKTNKHWVIIADDKTVIIYLGTHNLVDPSQSPDTFLMYFGRYYPSMGGTGFICVGGNISQSRNIAAIMFGGSSFMGTALRHPLTGLVDQGVGPGYKAWGANGPHPSASQYSTMAINLNPQAIQLNRVGVGGIGVGITGSTNVGQPAYLGHLRGLMFDSPTCYTSMAKFLELLGVTSPVASARLNTYTVGGKDIIPMYIHSQDIGCVVSLDEDDWEPLWS